MAIRPERPITYEDYVAFPDEPRLEVIGGEAYVVASPTDGTRSLWDDSSESSTSS